MSIPPRTRRKPGSPTTEALRDQIDMVTIPVDITVPPRFVGARVYHSTTQTITTDLSPVLFNSTLFDRGGLHTGVGSSGYLYAPIDGYYVLWACMQTSGTNGGWGAELICHRTAAGTDTTLAKDWRSGPGNSLVVYSGPYPFYKGDYAYVAAHEVHTGTRTITANSGYSPHFVMLYLGVS